MVVCQTVAELIAALSKMDPNAPVALYDGDVGFRSVLVEDDNGGGLFSPHVEIRPSMDEHPSIKWLDDEQ